MVVEIEKLTVSTLLIVGENDHRVLELNRKAFTKITKAEKRLDIIPDATHLFQEPGALEEVVKDSLSWFETNL